MSAETPAWSLQAGIDPRTWPDAVRAATAGLYQGLLLAAPPIVYAAEADEPIHEITRQWAKTSKASSGAVVVTSTAKRPPYGIIATQTCDLVEEGPPKRPWIQLCPVYVLRASKGDRKMIASRRGFPYLVAVTALPAVEDGIWVADLRLQVSVEKGWLVGRGTQPGFLEQLEFDGFADQLAARFARRAFASVVVTHVINPTLELLRGIATDFAGDDPIVESIELAGF